MGIFTQIFQVNRRPSLLLFYVVLFLFYTLQLSAAIDVSTCPLVYKRNNGNGQASSAAGNFTPYAQNNPVASNVVGTPYQFVAFDPASKTGNWNLYWDSQTPIINLPVITRCWYAPNGSTASVLSPIVFGPPPPPTVVGNRYYANYCFYVQNMPNIGIVTFEFTDPQTNLASFYCSFDLSSNNNTVKQVPCAPTVTTHPSNQTICGTGSNASFTVAASGYNSIIWQVSTDQSVWSDLTNGGDYSGVTTTTLQITNPTSLSGRYYRAKLTASGSSTYCSSTISYSNAAILQAYPKPTAVFSGSGSLCGFGSRNLSVDFTGTGPWTFTYTTNGASAVTVTNTLSDPYTFFVSPATTTIYAITYVSDRYCVESAPAGQVTVTVNPSPTITPTSPTICESASSMNVAYTATGSPNQYTLTSGTRVLDGFTASSGALTSSPLVVTIPTTETDAGDYDFFITATNSATGCSSPPMPFTLSLRDKPVLYLSGGENTVCVQDTVPLLVAPSNLSTYAWSSSPSSTISAVYNPLVIPTQTTTYTVTATDSYGCSATATKTVTATAGPALTISPSSPTICSGNAVSLTVSGSNSYSWSPATGLSTTSGSTVVATPTTTTTYTVTGESIDGCPSQGTVVVSVSMAPISVTGSATICSGAIRTLTASGGSSYQWYPATGLFTNAAATTAYVLGSNATTVYAKPTSSTTYYVEGTTSGGCTGIASTNITLSQAPVNIGSSTATNLIFCTQGVSTFPLDVQTNIALDSARWYYSTDGVSYTIITSAVSPTGVTLTPSSTGTSPNIKYTLTLSAYGSSGYTGPRFFELRMYSASTCNSSYAIYISDTKSNTIPPAPTASQYTICTGNSISLSVGTLSSGSTAQWQSSPDNSAWTNISGATTSTYTASPLVNTYYRVQYNGGTGSCGNNSTSRLITVTSSLSANTISPSSSCTNGSTSITLTGTAITSGTYQWQKSTTSSTSGFSDILGATNQNYTLPTNIVSANTWYRRIATNGTCLRDTSTAVVVYPPLSTNTILAGTLDYCGTSASATLITGSTPTGGSGTYQYQWIYSTNGTSYANVPSGGSTKDYTTSSQSQDYWYKRIVTSSPCTADTSGAVRISIHPNPTPSVTGSSSVCYEHQITLTAGGGTSYSWSPATYLNATTGESVFSTPLATTTYTVTVTNSYGCTATANTTLTVTSLPANPTLSSSTQTICSGTIDLNSYISSGGTNSWYTVPDHQASYLVSSPAAVSAAGTYYVFAVNGGCKSDGYASFTLSRHDTTAPSPAATALTYCAPATVDLTTLEPIEASGTEYRWSTSSTSPAANLVADPTQITASGTFYLYSYSTAGACYGNTSSAVTVNIYTRTNANATSDSVTLCAPTNVNLNDYYTSVGTNTYSWYTANQATAANRVAVPTAISTSGTYYLFATSPEGCTGNSDSIQVNIRPVVTDSIAIPAVSCNNNGIVLNAYSNATIYQWEVSTNGGSSYANVSSSSPYTNETTSALSISSTSGLSGYFYRCFLNNAFGCSTYTESVSITTDQIPVLSNPVAVQVDYGQDSSFYVTTTGTITAYYKWQYSTNDTTFSDVPETANWVGTDGPKLNLVLPDSIYDNYHFRAIAYNDCGADTSASALLKVVTCVPPAISSITSASDTICNNVTTTLTANGVSGTNTIITWWTGSGGTGDSLGVGDTLVVGPGTYYARVTGTCSPAAQVSITISGKTLPVIVGTQTGTPQCPDDLVKTFVTGKSGLNLSLSWWTGPNGTGILKGNTDTVYLPAGTFYARLSGDCGTVEQPVTITSQKTPSNNVYLCPTITASAFDECVQNDWTYFSLTAQDQYMFAIRKNGNVFTSLSHIQVVEKPYGQIADTAISHLYTSVSNAHGSYLMRRYWNVEVINGDSVYSTPVDIRFYYDPADSVKAKQKRDSAQLQYSNTTLTPWRWFKTVGERFNPDLIVGNDFSAFDNITLTPYAYGTENGVRYVQFNGVTSFSGGGGGFGFAGNASALPVEMSHFTAKGLANQTIRLDWTTQTELNNAGWYVERSTDGDNFVSIAWVDGKGNSHNPLDYRYDDMDIESGIGYYYRLKQMDLDGNWSYSLTVYATIGTSVFEIGDLYPNPASHTMHIPVSSWGDEDVQVQLIDITGRIAAVQKYSDASDRLTMDLSHLKAGVYQVLVTSGNRRFVKRLVFTP